MQWFLEWVGRGIEATAALIITMACIQAAVKAFILFFSPHAPPGAKVQVRLTLGRWLAIGLEFALAADILATAISPTWTDIQKLAAVAAIRTALNYFLGREIEAEAKEAIQLVE